MTADARIILGLMIGDEDPALVRRCIDSARPYVDKVVIQRNGPKDVNTGIHRAADLNAWDLSYWTPWVNFGANRTALLDQCRAVARGFGDNDRGLTYALLLDADHVFHGPLSRNLTAGAYEVRVQNPEGLTWRYPYLLRLGLPWTCKYPTHEVWTCDVEHTKVPLLQGDAWIEDRNDGTCKADKFERDERLITEYLAAHPGDTRMTFYLAQTLWCMWKRDRTEELRARAQTANLQRAFMGGWDQERCVALLRASECSDDVDDMITYAKAALHIDATRAEGWIRLAHVAHARKDWAMLGVYAAYASECYPRRDGLFVELDAYGWKARDLMALAAYRLGAYDTAAEHWAAALTSTPAPPPGAVAHIVEGLRRARDRVPA